MSSVLRTLVDDNRGLLEQGIRVIRHLSPELYRTNDHELFPSGVGKHMRHILDFYDRFLSGCATVIDYDARTRDQRVETDPDYAVESARRVIEQLSAILEDYDSVDVIPHVGDVPGNPVAVRVESCDASGIGMLTGSSLERELSQLANHTIHHYAIVDVVLRILGQQTPEGFGVAPSTLRYMAAQSS